MSSQPGLVPVIKFLDTLGFDGLFRRHVGHAALFQCAVLVYNTLRWMALLSGNAELKRWEPQSIRLYLEG